MILLISVIVFALACTIKGGLLGRVFTNWEWFTDKLDNKMHRTLSDIKKAYKARDYKRMAKRVGRLPYDAFLKWFFDGSIISVFLVAAYAAATLSGWDAVLLVAGWALVLSSMGEEAGAVGDYKGGWGDYILQGFGRSYGVKKGIQYGVFSGSVIALVMGSWCPWIAGASFPLMYYIGNSAKAKLTGVRDWSWSEPLWGAAIGLGVGLAHYDVLSAW